jgi:SPP1 gp7 family putative phage head morphogenesis protein
MSDALIMARQFRDALLLRDAAAQAEVLRAYETIWKKLAGEIERIARQIQTEGSSPTLIFQQGRLQSLQDQLAIEIERVASVAGRITVTQQSGVVAAARTQAVSLMKAAGRDAGARASFATLATDEVTHLVGIAQDGSPVAGLFKHLAKVLKLESGDVIKDELIKGMALGSNPRAIATAIRRSVDAKENGAEDPRMVRRLNMAVREQVIGAYTEVTRLSYQKNARLLEGWVWTAKRSATTCIVCWAMDGEIFPASEPKASHIGCRCVMRPLLPGQSPGELGPDAFAKLETGVQKSILGDTAYSAYESGMVELKDFVGIRSDFRWGDSRYRRSLEDIIGRATARKLRSRE